MALTQSARHGALSIGAATAALIVLGLLACLLAGAQPVRQGHVRYGPHFTQLHRSAARYVGCGRYRAPAVPFAVGAYTSAAYWFTTSTSFANPAVTLARATTDTFAGIHPADAPGFIATQALGATAATLAFRWLLAGPEPRA